MIELILGIYVLITSLIAKLWLGHSAMLSWAGFITIPIAFILWFINKVLHKKIVIDGVEISYK